MAKGKKKAGRKSKARTSKALTIQEELGQLQERWADAEARPQYREVPDGRYSAVISGAVVGKAKTSGRLQITWEMVISEGDFENWHVWKYDGLEGEESLDWVMTSLEILELDPPDDFSDIPEIIAEAVGLEVEVDLRTKDQIQNVYFRELVGEAELEEEEGEEAEEDDGEEEDEEEEGEEGSDEEELDLAGMTKADLLEYCEDNEIEVPAKITARKLRQLIADQQEEEEE